MVVAFLRMATNPNWLIPLVLVAVILVWKLLIGATYPRNLPLPPGPRPLPIIGNILDVPKTQQWISYRDMAAKYGDIIHLRVLGQTLILLGSREAVFELLEGRSATYSDRGMSTMISLMGWEWNMTMMPYGQTWRRHRRIFHQCFHRETIEAYQPEQLRATHRLLQRLSAQPLQFIEHTRHTFSAIMLNVAYGMQVAETDDEYIKIAEKAVQTANDLQPGSYLVEHFPILRFVPAWVPGAGFQRKAAKWRKDVLALREVPFAAAKTAINNGSCSSSITSALMEEISQLDDASAHEKEEVAKNVTGITYAAGVDTTLAATRIFFLAMVLYPEVQKRAQAELDAIVGSRQLPDFSHRDSLPYINAMVKECLRWQVVVPFALPHRCMVDDEYKGYYIPKGSLVMANSWALLHDPAVYPDPDEFKPERFLKDGRLDPEVTDPSTMAFGYGRRLCPGRHFAESSLWLIIASVLHVFDIGPPLDAKGQAMNVEPKMTSGLLSFPEELECTIEPRSTSAEALIHADGPPARS